jgi:hypothetical protein
MNRIKQFSHRLRKKEHGQSMVELAISLVLILVILAGIFDLGRAIIAYLVLQDAAEEGIVYGISFPTDCNQITSRIRGDVNTTLIKSQVMVAITIQNTSGNYTSCYSIPYAQVYAGRIMHIKITTNFPITMPFLGIPLAVTTNGVILRPPPPT